MESECEDAEESYTVELSLENNPELRSSVTRSRMLECMLHQLVYIKNVYPKEAFKITERDGVPLWICKYPEVREYILEFLQNADRMLNESKQIEIIISLMAGKEVSEEIHLLLKDDGSSNDSDPEHETDMNKLMSFCEDVQKTNIVTRPKKSNAEKKDNGFNLALKSDEEKPTSSLPDKIPDEDSDDCCVIYPVDPKATSSTIVKRRIWRKSSAPQKKTSKKVTPINKDRYHEYQVKSYLVKYV